MTLQLAKDYLAMYHLDDRIQQLDKSSATVEQAAEALNCAPERIAKTLSFEVKDKAILIVAAGDAKINNKTFKETFGVKPKMLPKDEVKERIGHDVGGVCPFGVKNDVAIYFDLSLKRFTTVFPACGTSNSAIELTIRELETVCKEASWVHVCKGWEAESALQ